MISFVVLSLYCYYFYYYLELAGESERRRSIAVPSNATHLDTIIEYPVPIRCYRDTLTRKTLDEMINDQTRICEKNKLTEKPRDPAQASLNNNEQTTIRKETEESDVVHNRPIDHYNRPGLSSAMDRHPLFESNEDREILDAFRQLQESHNLLFTEVEKFYE